MSYNVTHTATLKVAAKIRKTDLDRAVGHPDAAAFNFLAAHKDREPDVDGFVELRSLDWSGNWSGMSIELYEMALGLLVGSAEIVLIWEGGDSFSGYRIRNGRVERCRVERVFAAVESTIERGIELPAWSERGDDMRVTHGSPDHQVLASVTLLRKAGELDTKFDATVHTKDSMSSEVFGTAEQAFAWCEERLSLLGFRVARAPKGTNEP